MTTGAGSLSLATPYTVREGGGDDDDFRAGNLNLNRREEGDDNGVDCVWRLYCQEVNRLASGQGMTATVARINSVGFKVMLKLLPDDGVDNAAAKDLFRSLYKWKDLDCASLFDKCDAPPPPTSS